jgi:hypothetical protein
LAEAHIRKVVLEELVPPDLGSVIRDDEEAGVWDQEPHDVILLEFDGRERGDRCCKFDLGFQADSGRIWDDGESREGEARAGHAPEVDGAEVGWAVRVAPIVVKVGQIRILLASRASELVEAGQAFCWAELTDLVIPNVAKLAIRTLQSASPILQENEFLYRVVSLT